MITTMIVWLLMSVPYGDVGNYATLGTFSNYQKCEDVREMLIYPTTGAIPQHPQQNYENGQPYHYPSTYSEPLGNPARLVCLPAEVVSGQSGTDQASEIGVLR